VGEVVMLAVAKQKGTSAPVVTKEVRAALDSILSETKYQNLSYVVVSDDGVVANDEIIGLTQNLLTSIGIVALILLLFLSTRAALVVLITIPLTFLTVIGIGWLFEETINRITLFALILSLGLLVDASIVVVDTMYDALRRAHTQGRLENLPAIAAAAVKEVGVGLVLSAVTSVIVFLPMNYITGMMGPYMGPIAFFVPLALIVSLVIAIVLTPFIAIHILKADEEESILSRYFKTLLTRITDLYIGLLRKIAYEASVRKTVLLGAAVAFLVTLLFPLSGLVHFQMLPKADRDQVYVYIDLPKGTALTATKDFSEAVAAVILDHEETLSTQLFVGGAPIADFNGLFKGSPNRRASDQATLRVNLTKADTRSQSSTEITTELRSALAYALGDRSMYVRLMEEPPGPPVLATLVAKISADDTDVRQTAARSFVHHVKGIEGVVDTYMGVEAPVEQLVYTLDREKLATLGLSPENVTRWFMLTTSPLVVGEMVAAKASETVPITLTLPFSYTSTPGTAETIVVAGASGEAALAGLADKTYVPNESALYLEHAEAIEYVTAEVEGRSIVYVVIEIMRGLITGTWEGYEVRDWGLFGLTLVGDDGESFSLTWGGEWEMTLENFRDLGVAMVVALFLVYAVLVAQYRSFAVPGFILVTVPLGLVGIFTGFLFLDSLFGIYLTATALIGFIALIGIVVNNAIIYLEYVEQALVEGVTYTEALIAAGAMRLRPILLTSLTTVLGSLTIASDPVWSGLAWAIIFGLSLSTILTLVIFPALLMTFSRQEET
jgi:multidrug efflux pump subunit AcrB